MQDLKAVFFIFIIALGFPACTSQETNQKSQAAAEIAAAEKAFEKMAAEKGIATAFWFFADTAAVIKRGNDSLIKGKEGIRNFYSAPYFNTARVKWSPDFVEASGSGDMGYTFGRYEWSSTDSLGAVHTSTGIFHTVWKKQKDGSWRYTWD